jgi:Na+-transporting NADH:ubiquinone oxidoreductase subunit NqrB
VRGAVRRVLHVLNTRSWAVLLLFMVSSVLLLPLFEVEGNRQGGTFYGDRIFGAIATGFRTSSWVPALVALGFATGFVHYLLDRSVYRLSDPHVRSAARGLLAPPGGRTEAA